jgi:DNA replication protein DnaC
LADNQETEKQLNAMQNHNLINEWDARKFYQTIKSHFITRFGLFKGHIWQKDYIRAICLLLSHDARFQAEMNLNFEKGILVKGKSGLGKTEIIRAISANPIRPIKIISILDICDEVKENGFCELNTKERILIDDVGTEPEVINHYGTRINWFKDFIEKYYLHANGNFSKLLITTNLTGDDFEARYGLRVRSRMREMFNVINLAGNDLRK